MPNPFLGLGFNSWSRKFSRGRALAVLFDLTQGSLPSGMYHKVGTGPTMTFDAIGVKLTGGAGSDSYPLRIASSFSGDYLFQLSTRIDSDSGGNAPWCSDASLAMFNTTYDGSTWAWQWSYTSGRIAAQNNCANPTLYGETTLAASFSNPLKDPTLNSGDFVTMHLRHLPSEGKTTYKVTKGANDWNENGTNITGASAGDALEVANSFTGDYYVGISADDDTNSMYANALRYVKL